LTEASVKIHQSTDRLSNRFCLRKTQLLIQRSSFVGFRSPSCFNLHGQHILSGLPFQTKLPLSHASLMCSLSCFGLRGEPGSQLPKQSGLTQLALYCYDCYSSSTNTNFPSSEWVNHTTVKLCPFLQFTDTRRMPSMNLIPVGKTTGIVTLQQLSTTHTAESNFLLCFTPGSTTQTQNVVYTGTPPVRFNCTWTGSNAPLLKPRLPYFR
jgi:hypothetical protein